MLAVLSGRTPGLYFAALLQVCYNFFMDGVFFDRIADNINIEEKDAALYSPLVLAYLGDTVYEVYVRTYLVTRGKMPVHRLHKDSVRYVKAAAQAKILHSIADGLTDEEKDIVRRGRNANSGTVPKNADVNEYRHATGLECLIGYLYLKRDYQRLLEILDLALKEVQDD